MISLTHNAADGTTVTGDTQPHAEMLRAHGFRWSRQSDLWYLPHSRDKLPNNLRIGMLLDNLQRKGVEYESSIDAELRPMAEREAARNARLERRQDGLEAKAERLEGQAEAKLAKASAIMDMIPMGQPILVGHHSERRHRRDLAKIEKNLGDGFALQDEAKETARRADASRSGQDHRESGPTTVRRIERLNAERRDIERKLAPCGPSGRKMKAEAAAREIRCPGCYNTFTIGDDLLFPKHGHADGSWAERLNARLAAIDDEVGYWTMHLAQLEADGIWSAPKPAEFAKGDRVLVGRSLSFPATVVRVNKKSVSVIVDGQSWSNTYTFDKVIKQPAVEPEKESA